MNGAEDPALVTFTEESVQQHGPAEGTKYYKDLDLSLIPEPLLHWSYFHVDKHA